MDLTPAERSNLATFFAKRFPTASDRTQLARAAAVVEPNANTTSAHAAWERLIADAEQAGRLARLAHAAADRVPEDANLRKAALLIGPAPSPWPKLALMTSAVAVPVIAVFAVGVVAVSVGAFDGTEATAAPQATELDAPALTVQADAEVPDAPVAEGVADDAVAPVPPVVEAAPADNAPDTPVVQDEQGTASPSPPPASSSAPNATDLAPANHRGRCTQPGGGLIGYWYAGSVPPGQQGDVVSVPRDMNVRAWVPSVSNDFDARGPVRCVLATGDRVRLSHPPVPVPVDSFWVPLYSGDIVSEN